MNFADAMADNPPRLVVMMGRAENGDERFEWGLTGKVPMMSLIGSVAQAQVRISSGEWMPECDQPAFVMVYDAAAREFNHFLSPDIPADPLVGMLEIVKAALVGSRMGQHAAAQMNVLGLDGKPMRA